MIRFALACRRTNGGPIERVSLLPLCAKALNKPNLSTSFRYPLPTERQYRPGGNRGTITNRRQYRRQSFSHLSSVYSEALEPLAMRQSLLFLSFDLPIDTINQHYGLGSRACMQGRSCMDSMPDSVGSISVTQKIISFTDPLPSN